MSDITPQSWAQDLLTRMGYPVTQNNMTSVLAWEYQEGGHFSNAATFNPLNSTLGHGTYGSMNSVGVSTYPDYETGMKETIKTINLHYYDKIRSDLQASADPSTTTADIKASPWGTWHGGASTKGALGRAGQTVAAHPVTAVPTTPAHPATPAPAHPASAAPTPVHPKSAPASTATAANPATTPPSTTTAPAKPAASTPSTGSVAPVVAGAAAGTAVGASTATGSGGGSFEGADVDGLDTLAREFTQAAQIVDEVKMACEVIVAAASIFGPFGAAFVAYLKGTVIPWLTRISQALTAMSKVLAQHSQAQKDASSTATSLPSYTSPGGANPTTSTQDFPLIGAVAGALSTGAMAVMGPIATLLPRLPGAVPVTTPAGETHVPIFNGWATVNLDRAGNVDGVSLPEIHVRSGPSTPATDQAGNVVGEHESITGDINLNGETKARFAAQGVVAHEPGLSGVLGGGFDVGGNAQIQFGDGKLEVPDAANTAPGGVNTGGVLSEHTDPGVEIKPERYSIGANLSSGSVFGNSISASAEGTKGSVALGGLLGGGPGDLLGGGGDAKLSASAGAQAFFGTNHLDGQTTSGAALGYDANAGASAAGGPQFGPSDANVQFTVGKGLGIGEGMGFVALQHGPDAAPRYDLDVRGEVDEMDLSGHAHYDTAPVRPGEPRH